MAEGSRISGPLQRTEADALEFVAGLAGMGTPADVVRALARAIAPYGYTTYALGGLPHPDFPFPGAFFFHNWPEIWDRWYAERGFGPEDPVREAAARSSEPLTIRQIRTGAAGFLPSAKGIEMLGAARDLGRGDGLMVPVHGPGGYHGIVCFAGAECDPGPKARALLHMIALYAHNRMRELHTAASPGTGRPALSAREAQVLLGARNGMDDEAIARWLGIGVRTVRFHFGNARRKLGARQRAEAVAIAESDFLLPR